MAPELIWQFFWNIRLTETATSSEKLDQAITVYKGLKGQLTGPVQNNLLIALLWAHRFAELADLTAKMQGPEVDSLRIAAIAGKDGIGPAIAEAAKRVPDDQSRRTAVLRPDKQCFDCVCTHSPPSW